jgi:hypothetical protein
LPFFASRPDVRGIAMLQHGPARLVADVSGIGTQIGPTRP